MGPRIIIIGLLFGILAQAQVIPQKIEKGLHDAGTKLETATRKLVDEAGKSAKQADQKVRQTSLYDDFTGAAQRAWTSFESGLKKMLSSSQETAPKKAPLKR